MSCNCKRLKCFETLTTIESLASNDEQNAYLVGLMTLVPVQRRRPRQAEEDTKFHDASFAYTSRVKRCGVTKDINACFKAYQSIHGISRDKIEYLQKNLKTTGTAGKDKRGEHSSKHRLSRLSHYLITACTNLWKNKRF